MSEYECGRFDMIGVVEVTLGLTHDLFGRKCLIKTGYSERDFVYRIIRSGVSSNGWSEVPLTYQTETNPTVHETSESVLFVIVDIKRLTGDKMIPKDGKSIS